MDAEIKLDADLQCLQHFCYSKGNAFLMKQFFMPKLFLEEKLYTTL